MDFSFEQKFVDTGKGKIYYFLNKKYTGRPVVLFIHGLSSNHTTWEEMAELLDKRGINSLLVELRGHGHSDKIKERSLYKINQLTEDLELIIGKEKLENIFIVGYSFGGTIAIDYILKEQRKVKAAILISANHASPLFYWGVSFLIKPARVFVNFLAYLLKWQKLKSYHYYEHSAPKRYWRSVWLGLHTMPLSINFWMLNEYAYVDYRNKLHNIKIPVKLICSDYDPYLTKKEIAEMKSGFPDCEVIISKNKNHFIATKTQGEIFDVLIASIDKYENSDI